MCDLAVMYFRLRVIYTYHSMSSLCFDFVFFGIVFDVLTYNISPVNVEAVISKIISNLVEAGIFPVSFHSLKLHITFNSA